MGQGPEAGFGEQDIIHYVQKAGVAKNWEAGDRARSLGWFFHLQNSHTALATTVSHVESNTTLSPTWSPHFHSESYKTSTQQQLALFKAPIRSWFLLPKTFQQLPNKLIALTGSDSYISHLRCFRHSSLFWTSQSLSCLGLLHMSSLCLEGSSPNQLLPEFRISAQLDSHSPYHSPSRHCFIILITLGTCEIIYCHLSISCLPLSYDLNSLRVDFSFVLFTVLSQCLM